MESDSEQTSFGSKAADKLNDWIATWTFVLTQNAGIFLWVVANLILKDYQWDPYPFILLNFVLSFQAAQTGPITLISNKRQERILLHQQELIHSQLRYLSHVIEALMELLGKSPEH